MNTIKYLCWVTLVQFLWGCGNNSTEKYQLNETFPVIRQGPNDMKFAFIPNGLFRMGAVDSGSADWEDENIHWVKLTKDYWMQTTEVTFGQWHSVMGSYPDTKGCHGKNTLTIENDFPVVCVSWDDVKIFIDKLNYQKSNHFTYRLPTEAEWENAARAFHESDYSIQSAHDSFIWSKQNSKGVSHRVGQLKPNLFGLYDTFGNVAEWTADWYKTYPVVDSSLNPIKNPNGPAKGVHKVIRGGSYLSHRINCIPHRRSRGFPNNKGSDTGFRLVRVE